MPKPNMLGKYGTMKIFKVLIFTALLKPNRLLICELCILFKQKTDILAWLIFGWVLSVVEYPHWS